MKGSLKRRDLLSCQDRCLRHRYLALALLALSGSCSTVCLAQPQPPLPPPRVELQARSVDGVDLLGMLAQVTPVNFLAVRDEHSARIDVPPHAASMEQLREEIIARSGMKHAERNGIVVVVNACRLPLRAERNITLKHDDPISLYFNRIAPQEFFALMSRTLDLELLAPDGLPSSDLALAVREELTSELLATVDSVLSLDTRVEGGHLVVRKLRGPRTCATDESEAWRPVLPDAVARQRSLDELLRETSGQIPTPCKRLADLPETRNRTCRYLEHFALEDLLLRGYIRLTPSSPYGVIVETPTKAFLQQVYVGDRMGERFGLVAKIEPQAVELIERSVPAQSGTTELLTRISLQDGSVRSSAASPSAIAAAPREYREDLERYDLEDLWIRSAKEVDGRWQATVTDPFGVNHVVHVHNYMGTNLGKITSITPGEVDLEEIVPNALGGYDKKETVIVPGMRYEDPRKARLRKYAAPINTSAVQAEFIDAARQADRLRLHQLLERGARIDAADGDQRDNALVAAIGAQKADAVIWLLAHGAKTNILVGRWQETPLHVAAWLGTVEIAQQLIMAGADVNFRDGHERTAIVQALVENHDPVVALLVTKGADTKSVDELGLTPFTRAAYYGRTAAVELFLEHGVTIFDRDESGYTLLSAAAQGQNRALVASLIGRGSDVNAISPSGESVLDLARRAAAADPEIIELLVSRGARSAKVASDR
jgi:ankyrin repeat protein